MKNTKVIKHLQKCISKLLDEKEEWNEIQITINDQGCTTRLK